MLACTAAVALALSATAAHAQQRSFDLPAQDARRSIPEFGRQAGIQISAPTGRLRGVRTPAVQGNLDVREALRRLLAGTGLEIAQDNGAIIVLRERRTGQAPGEADAGSAAAEDGSADQGAGIAEILVVGSPSQNVDVRRSEDDPQPYVVFNREEIQRSQATNLEEFFRTRLPMNSQMQSSATGTGADGLGRNPLGNNSQINLRGLGTNQTLILVDGRRLPRVLSNTTEFTQGDLNGIPLSSIERIEVLPSTAGGIYGGGAVGGVINIIRRRDYRGIDLRASYQGTFRGGGESYRFDVTGGFSPDGGRTQISFAGSYSDARPLYARDNDLADRGRELLNANDPVHYPLAGYTTNIRSVSGANLVFDNGTLLNSNRTHIPSGYPGRLAAGDNGLALLPNAGRYNLELSNDSQGGLASLRSDPRVSSVNVNVRRELFSWLDSFADFTYGESLSRSNYSGVATAITLPANAPNNPFQQDIIVLFPLNGTEQPARIEIEALSATAGLIFRPSSDWSATVEYSISRSITRSDYANRPVETTINTLIQTGALDVLRDLNQYPINYAPYLGLRPDFPEFETRQQTISARVAGKLMELPGGPLSLNALLEHREEVAEPDQFSTATTTTYRFGRSQANNAAYAELLVPLVSDRNAMPLVQALELQLSIRHDRFSTKAPSPTQVTLTNPNTQLPDIATVENRFNSTDFTVAGRWSPVRDITFRASYGTGFLPASISQIVGSNNPNLVNGQGLVDPRRGNTSDPTLRYNIRTGGNADLLPEQSRNLSLGAIVTPSFLPAFRLSVDYTSIRKRNEIVAPQDQDIVSNEDLFPGRVQRGPNRPGDPAGWAGPITFINRTLTNFSRTKVESLDFQADYEFTLGNVGTFHAYALASRQLRLQRQFLTTTTLYDLVDAFIGPLKWRANGGIDWRSGGWRASWNMQFYHSYSVLYGDPAQASTGAAQVVVQGSNRIPSQTYHDIYVGYDFPADHPLAGLRASLGIQNIFDHRPPVIAFPLNGYSRYGDPRLRRFTLSVSKSF